MTRTSIASLIGCLLLLGCSSDFALHATLGEQPPVEVGPWEGPGPSTVPPGPNFPDPPNWPDPPAPPTGPWGEINPGNIPEIYFAVAWTEYECSWDDMDGDEPYDEPPDTTDDDGDGLDEDSWWGGCPARYAVIDLMGQVIAEFPLPGEQPDWTAHGHLALEPAGPGQFIAVAENWMDDCADTDEDGFWLGTYWQAWLGDAYTGEIQEIAHWNFAEDQVQITQSGRLLDLGGYSSWAHLGMWTHDPDWLVVWSGGQDCQPLQNLRQIHLAGGQLDRFWEPEDLLPPELITDDPVYLWPWNMETGLDEQGRPNMLLGVSDAYCAEDSPPRWDMVAWSPIDGPLWTAEAAGWSWMQSARWAGHGGGAMLEVEPDWGGSTWRVHRPDGVVEGPLPEGVWDVTAGPMLDPEGPTFMTIGSEMSELGQYRGVIDVHHEGEVVWRIEQLRFGLQQRNVFFEDVVMIPLLPEEPAE